MRRNYRLMVFSIFFLLGFCISYSGCAIFRATGRTVEAVGEGAGHAVSGTGRAISNAASETKRELTGR